MKPTVVLVHGAFAESSSWDGVIDPLLSDGYAVVAAPNPLRSLASDAEAVSDVVRSIEGPVLLVGHSYGGMVISNVAADSGEIVGLVYACAFAPAPGESAFTLSEKFPGSTLGDAVRPTPLTDGKTDLRIAADLFHDQFAADVDEAQTDRMAVTQRPATLEALQEASGEHSLWENLPSWFLIGTEDRNIPAELQRFLAERADARRTVEIEGGSHAISVSHPKETAALILEAASVAQGADHATV